MEDFSNFPPQKPKIDFQEVIEALLQPDTPFPARLLFGFSDLQGNDLEQLKEIWPEINPERRERLIEDLELFAESNFLVSFDEAYKIGLSDQTSRVRQLALRALWESEDTALIPVFIELLDNDPSMETRAQAAGALGKFIYLGDLEEIDEEEFELVLAKLLEVSAVRFPELVRRRALEAMGFSTDKRVTALIEEAYHQNNDEWLISALIAMGRSAHQQWVPMVIENIDHPDNVIRLRAVQAAGNLYSQKAVEHLVGRLQDPDDEVRMAAVWSLSEIGGDDAREAIEFMLDETEDEDELDMIEDALENLEISDMAENFDLFDLDEEDLEDMIHTEDEEDIDE